MINMEREVGVMGRRGRWMEEDREGREVTASWGEYHGEDREVTTHIPLPLSESASTKKAVFMQWNSS